MEIKTDKSVVVVMNQDIKENLSIKVDDKMITLNINPYKIFSSLLYRDLILGCINNELNKLLKEHLTKMSEKEALR